MSEYLTALKTTTGWKDKDDWMVLNIIKEIAGRYPVNYGWRQDILDAETTREACEEFNITLYSAMGDLNIPILNNTYNSQFIEDVAKAIAPYMVDGYIEGHCTGRYKFKVTFVGGRVVIKNDKPKPKAKPKSNELPFA